MFIVLLVVTAFHGLALARPTAALEGPPDVAPSSVPTAVTAPLGALTTVATAVLEAGSPRSGAALRVRADGSGALYLNLRGLPARTPVLIEVHRGGCASSARLFALTGPTTSDAGVAARTIALPADRVARVRAAPAVIRLTAGATQLCGRFVATAAGRSAPLFGTLLSDPDRARAEYAAGIRVVHLELSWALYEPRDGTFNARYAAEARQRLAGFTAAGMKVVLGVGLQYPPAWTFDHPDSRYVDQFGRASAELNLTFNSTLRARADAYLRRVNEDLGLANFWAVRVGAGALIETLYPDSPGGSSFWAYDRNAQAGSPAPGWAPGDATYRGQPFSIDQVRAWYDWYLDSLVDGVNWQIAAYRGLGYRGFIHVLMPGQGVRPTGYEATISRGLEGPADVRAVAARGAAWDRVIQRLRDRAKVVAYVSSVADGSGSDDRCLTGDASLPPTSPQIDGWSAVRWISYNAARYGLLTLGENPGPGDTSSYGRAMLERAVAQMASCGFQGLMWAHADNLYEAGSDVTLGVLRRVIAQT